MECVCGGELKFYDGAIGYEAMVCQKCGEHWADTNLNDRSAHMERYRSGERNGGLHCAPFPLVTKDRLEAFISEMDESVTQGRDEMALFPNGNACVICTFGAEIVAKHFGGQVFGFPGGTPGVENMDTRHGHDFALIGNRWIVDYWIVYVVGDKRGVFDLEDPNDAELIRHYYGDRRNWVSMEERKQCLNQPK